MTYLMFYGELYTTHTPSSLMTQPNKTYLYKSGKDPLITGNYHVNKIQILPLPKPLNFSRATKALNHGTNYKGV